MNHKWSKEDDIVALYLYKYGSNLSIKKPQIAAKLGMSLSSLNMRISNFKALDGGNGLPNAAKQSDEVLNQYRNSSQSDHLEMVKVILNI